MSEMLCYSCFSISLRLLLPISHLVSSCHMGGACLGRCTEAGHWGSHKPYPTLSRPPNPLCLPTPLPPCLLIFWPHGLWANILSYSLGIAFPPCSLGLRWSSIRHCNSVSPKSWDGHRFHRVSKSPSPLYYSSFFFHSIYPPHQSRLQCFHFVAVALVFLFFFFVYKCFIGCKNIWYDTIYHETKEIQNLSGIMVVV